MRTRKALKQEKRKKLINHIELMTGRLVIRLVISVLGIAIVYGILSLLGIFINWIETSTVRTIIFIALAFIVLAKAYNKEFSE